MQLPITQIVSIVNYASLGRLFSFKSLWKWKVYGKDQSFFTHPLGWPGKSTDLGTGQLGLEYGFKLNVVIITVVQSCSYEELVSAG